MSTTEPVPLTETPDLHGAFPRLSDPQIDALSARGQRRPMTAGEVLYREGDAHCDFFGELGLLTGQPSFLTAVARTPGEVWSCRWSACATWSQGTPCSAT